MVGTRKRGLDVDKEAAAAATPAASSSSPRSERASKRHKPHDPPERTSPERSPRRKKQDETPKENKVKNTNHNNKEEEQRPPPEKEKETSRRSSKRKKQQEADEEERKEKARLEDEQRENERIQQEEQERAEEKQQEKDTATAAAAVAAKKKTLQKQEISRTRGKVGSMEDASDDDSEQDSSYSSSSTKKVSKASSSVKAADTDLVSPNKVGRMGLTPQWVTMLKKLAEYKSKEGHCRVPRRYADDPALGNWVRFQRQSFLQQKMPPERIIKLEEIGFEFVIEPEGLSWETTFNDLKDYKEKNGNCDIPSGYDESPQLLQWTNYQRELYRKGKLTDEQKAKLESIGFEWEHKWPSEKAPNKSLDEIWDMQLDKLARFKKQHGHCHVPCTWKQDPKFARWIETQRTAYRRGQLTDERIQKLEALGFEWSVKTRAIPSQSAPTEEQEAMWQASFQKLKAFKEENGHCDISEKDHPALSKWVGTQRTVYRRNQMTQQRKEALESLGFDFGAPPDALTSMMTPRIQQQEQTWNQRLDELKMFKQEFGHCNVPGSYARDPVLARWVGTQRTTYRRGQMPQDRINALEVIGFQWRITDGTSSFSSNTSTWSAMLEKLKAYKEKNGDCNVPVDYEADPSLARWVKIQTQANRFGRLPEERKSSLDSLGFDWTADVDADIDPEWDVQFEKLKSYQEEYGHCNVPRDYDADPELGLWVHEQRTINRREQMPPDQKHLLNSLGFNFRLPEHGSSAADKCAVWQMQFEKLRVFKMANGHCNVPTGYGPDPAFSRWVATQRTVQRRNQMQEDRKAMLDSLGFEWRLVSKGRTWEESFYQLKEFQEKTGHCCVPASAEDAALRNWVTHQRQKYAKGSLSTEQIQDLESIGFVWSTEDEKDSVWDIRFEQLCQLSKGGGGSGVAEDPDLLEWISKQHTAYFHKTLSPEQIEKLASIGFVFNVDSIKTNSGYNDGDKKPAPTTTQRVSWNRHYEQLLLFKEAYGHTNVPSDYREDPRLARWVINQRKLHSKGEGPTQERTEKLNAIGFDWNYDQNSNVALLDLKTPSVASMEDEAETLIAAAVNMTEVARSPERKATTVVDTPTIHWTQASDPTPQTAAAQQGVKELAVSLEVSRAKLDKENKQLKKANTGLKTANLNLTKRVAEMEASQMMDTIELRERLQHYDVLFSTYAEAIQKHGEQLKQMAQAGHNRTEDDLKEQAEMLHSQGVQLIELAKEIQDLRQVQDAPPKEEGDLYEVVKV